VIIGALATFAEIGKSALVKRYAPRSPRRARQIGGAQIQNRATIGGNIANASPAADAVPVLAAAEATLVLVGVAGERRVPVTEFFPGYRRTALARRRADRRRRAAPRPAGVVPQGGHARGERDLQGGDGRRADWSRASRSAASRPPWCGCRAPRRRWRMAASIDAACSVLLSEIEPIDDLRSTATYRRQVAANLLRQFWKETGR
jgi:CO/xanthine dehydrogenase FAD-binding subunit